MLTLDQAKNSEYYRDIHHDDIAAINNYVRTGTVARNFIMCILRSDHLGMLRSANLDDLSVLKKMSRYVNRQTPLDCRGSDDTVRLWITEHETNAIHGPEDLIKWMEYQI